MKILGKHGRIVVRGRGDRNFSTLWKQRNEKNTNWPDKRRLWYIQLKKYQVPPNKRSASLS